MCENNNCESLPSRTLCFRHEQLCKPVLGNPLLSVEAYSASAEQRVVNIKDPQLKIFIIPFSTKYLAQATIVFPFDERQTKMQQMPTWYFFVTFLQIVYFVVVSFSFYVTKYFC